MVTVVFVTMLPLWLCCLCAYDVYVPRMPTCLWGNAHGAMPMWLQWLKVILVPISLGAFIAYGAYMPMCLCCLCCLCAYVTYNAYVPTLLMYLPNASVLHIPAPQPFAYWLVWITSTLCPNWHLYSEIYTEISLSPYIKLSNSIGLILSVCMM